MQVLQKNNWEDVCCPGCRSELRAHPRDITVEKLDWDYIFYVQCPLCSYHSIRIYPPRSLHEELREGWPTCACQGDPEHAERSNDWHCRMCDWREIKYTPPS